MITNNLAKLFVAMVENRVVGGIITTIDKDTLHYNWGASNYYQNIAIGTLLIDYTINYAINNRYKYYDLGSTPLFDDNLYNFKMRFGATNYSVYKYFTIKKPNIINLNSSFSMIRGIYSRMPMWLLRYAVPKMIPWIVD